MGNASANKIGISSASANTSLFVLCHAGAHPQRRRSCGHRRQRRASRCLQARLFFALHIRRVGRDRGCWLLFRDRDVRPPFAVSRGRGHGRCGGASRGVCANYVHVNTFSWNQAMLSWWPGGTIVLFPCICGVLFFDIASQPTDVFKTGVHGIRSCLLLDIGVFFRTFLSRQPVFSAWLWSPWYTGCRRYFRKCTINDPLDCLWLFFLTVRDVVITTPAVAHIFVGMFFLFHSLARGKSTFSGDMTECASSAVSYSLSKLLWRFCIRSGLSMVVTLRPHPSTA